MWSSYTATAGIHSEVDSGVTARQEAFTRRMSGTLTTEETLHKKQLNALSKNKQSLEKSMLAYTNKMRKISEKKANQPEQLTENIHSSKRKNNSNVLKVPVTINAFCRDGSVTPPTDRQTDHEPSPRMLSSEIHSPIDPLGRESIDSGISVEWRCESSDTSFDAYYSDSENRSCIPIVPVQTSPVSTKHRYRRHSPSSVCSDSFLDEARAVRRRRERRRRLGVGDKPELPTVADTESQEQGQSSTLLEVGGYESEDSINISPFPGIVHNTLNTENQETKLPQISVAGNISTWKEFKTNTVNRLSSGKTHWAYTVDNSPKQPNTVLTKQKVLSSPSVASTRFRKASLKAKPAKLVHRIFRYSDAVEHAIQSPINSDDAEETYQRDACPIPAELPSTVLKELRQENTLQSREVPDVPVSTERCLSAPVNYALFLGTLKNEEVQSDENSKLKSAMKKSDSCRESRTKRSVHFFLPDIFRRPNAFDDL